MSFTYDFDNNARIANVRLLIADTDESKAIFSDEEIEAAYRIQQATWQSGMMWGSTMGRANLPSPPASPYRVAAVLLDALASNQTKLSGVVQALEILDVKVTIGQAASAARSQAKNFREVDDESASFAIVEQVTTSFGFVDQFVKTVQRQGV